MLNQMRLQRSHVSWNAVCPSLVEGCNALGRIPRAGPALSRRVTWRALSCVAFECSVSPTLFKSTVTMFQRERKPRAPHADLKVYSRCLADFMFSCSLRVVCSPYAVCLPILEAVIGLWTLNARASFPGCREKKCMSSHSTDETFVLRVRYTTIHDRCIVMKTTASYSIRIAFAN